MFDGTFKEAGAHLEQYVLEHENGARAIGKLLLYAYDSSSINQFQF